MVATPFAQCAQDYNQAISENVFNILNQLKFDGKLRDRNIAVFGFCEAQTDEGCAALTHSIADKVMSAIHMYKMASSVLFGTVARKNLLAIEIEYFISSSDKDKGMREAMDLLKPADLLFTGTWQNGDGQFDLNLQVHEVMVRGTEVAAFKQVSVDKMGLSGDIQDCLFKKGGGGPDPDPGAIRALQEKINDYDRRIEEIRRRQQSAQREKDMRAALEEKRDIVARLTSKPGKGVAYTTRNYKENFAFINVETTPSDLDVYIDGAWVARSPLEMYEIEASVEHTISVKGDPRYFREARMKRKYERWYRATERLSIERGTGKVLLLARKEIRKVLVDGVEVPFDPKKPLIEVSSGKRRFEAFSGCFKGDLEEDVWTGDVLRRDLSLQGPDLRKAPPIAFSKEPWTGMEFVWVPGGSYEMGCGGSWAGECFDTEKPAHEVCVDGFWMGKYEVTQRQWETVMGSNPSNFQKGGDYPVEQVSWEDAMEFVPRLNKRTGHVYQLPTEAQWEYACRSGGKKQTYAGGGDVDRVAWYDANSSNTTHSVGGKAPNGLGIYDMSGNVWEWCLDEYDPNAYRKHHPVNPVIGTVSCAGSRAVRGGAWSSDARRARCGNRFDFSSENRISYLGFRLARIK